MQHSVVVMHHVDWRHSMLQAQTQKNMMTWVIWIQWKWNQFVNGKCSSRVNYFYIHCTSIRNAVICFFSVEISLLIFVIFITFTEKYEYVGRLLRPGEEPNSYSDEEEESSESSKANKNEDITNINSTDASATATDKPKNEWLKSEPINSNHSLKLTSKSLASVKESSNCNSNNNEIIAANGTNDQWQKQ